VWNGPGLAGGDSPEEREKDSTCLQEEKIVGVEERGSSKKDDESQEVPNNKMEEGKEGKKPEGDSWSTDPVLYSYQ